MKTVEEIRNDIEELRYYYLMEKSFPKDELEPCGKLADLISNYSKIMVDAPSRFQGFFNARCKLNLSIQEMAKDWNVSMIFVKTIQSEFVEYLLKIFNKEES